MELLWSLGTSRPAVWLEVHLLCLLMTKQADLLICFYISNAVIINISHLETSHMEYGKKVQKKLCIIPFLSVFLSLLFALSLLLLSLSLERDRRPSSPGLANSRTLSRSHSRSPRARSRRCISLSLSAHRSRTPPTPRSRSRSRSRSLSLSLSRSRSLSLSRSGMRGGSRFGGPADGGAGSFSFSGFRTPLWKSS